MKKREFYGLRPGFPRDQFVVRSDKDDYKAIYFVSSAVKKVLMASNSAKLKVCGLIPFLQICEGFCG